MPRAPAASKNGWKLAWKPEGEDALCLFLGFYTGEYEGLMKTEIFNIYRFSKYNKAMFFKKIDAAIKQNNNFPMGFPSEKFWEKCLKAIDKALGQAGAGAKAAEQAKKDFINGVARKALEIPVNTVGGRKKKAKVAAAPK